MWLLLPLPGLPIFNRFCNFSWFSPAVCVAGFGVFVLVRQIVKSPINLTCSCSLGLYGAPTEAICIMVYRKDKARAWVWPLGFWDTKAQHTHGTMASQLGLIFPRFCCGPHIYIWVPTLLRSPPKTGKRVALRALLLCPASLVLGSKLKPSTT